MKNEYKKNIEENKHDLKEFVEKTSSDYDDEIKITLTLETGSLKYVCRRAIDEWEYEYGNRVNTVEALVEQIIRSEYKNARLFI